MLKQLIVAFKLPLFNLISNIILLRKIFSTTFQKWKDWKKPAQTSSTKIIEKTVWCLQKIGVGSVVYSQWLKVKEGIRGKKTIIGARSNFGKKPSQTNTVLLTLNC